MANLKKVILRDSVKLNARVHEEIQFLAHEPAKMGADLTMTLLGDLVEFRVAGEDPVAVPLSNVKGMWLDADEQARVEPNDGGSAYTVDSHPQRKPGRPKGSKNRKGS